MRLIWCNRLIFILSIIGLAISGYLFYTYIVDAPIVCANTGCETVRESPYSYFLGIPLPFFGGFMYLGIFLLGFAKTIIHKDFIRKAVLAIFWLALAGVLISAYLTYLELFVIHAVCMWCVSQAVVVTVIFMVSLYEVNIMRYESKR